jgi:hypothetical protein
VGVVVRAVLGYDTSQRFRLKRGQDGTDLVLDPGAADALGAHDGRQSFRRFIQVVVEFDQEMEKGRSHLLPLGLEECRCRPSVPRKSAIRVAIIA